MVFVYLSRNDEAVINVDSATARALYTHILYKNLISEAYELKRLRS